MQVCNNPRLHFAISHIRLFHALREGIKQRKMANLLSYKKHLHHNLIALILSLDLPGPYFTNTKIFQIIKKLNFKEFMNNVDKSITSFVKISCEEHKERAGNGNKY